MGRRLRLKVNRFKPRTNVVRIASSYVNFLRITGRKWTSVETPIIDSAKKAHATQRPTLFARIC